ncbi:MAG TPA: SDR family oxidoreductase [Gaiellaceae bacterium]
MPDERVVILTGAGGGLGSEAVKQLSRRGVRLVAVDINEESLSAAVAAADGDGEIVAVTADVTDEASVRGFVDDAVSRWGRLDGIFNNAAIQGHVGPFVDYETDELWRVLRVNLFAAWLGMKYAIPHLIANGGGSIVNTGSSLAYRGWKEVPAYVASKHALAGLTKTVAIEYGSKNIRANLLSPSSMNAPMLWPVAENVGGGDLEAGLREIAALAPNGQLAQPGDVAEIGVWLLLDAPAHLSGVILPVDGAETAG